jgi:hypothetical protein
VKSNLVRKKSKVDVPREASVRKRVLAGLLDSLLPSGVQIQDFSVFFFTISNCENLLENNHFLKI